MHISEDDINAIQTWAAKHAKIKKIYLYGSRARGDHRPDSDIDLAIEMHIPEGQTSAYAQWFFGMKKQTRTFIYYTKSTWSGTNQTLI